MDTNELTTAIRFYLRRLRRLTRAQRAPLPEAVEVHAGFWDPKRADRPT